MLSKWMLFRRKKIIEFQLLEWTFYLLWHQQLDQMCVFVYVYYGQRISKANHDDAEKPIQL